MTHPKSAAMVWVALATLSTAPVTPAADLFPPAAKIKTDRPRLLLRPRETPYAIATGQLKAIPPDADFRQMLAQLRQQRSPAAQAMVWLLTGEPATAEKAIESMRGYKFPGGVDTFHIYYNLRQIALAYDWLYDYDGFTEQIKAEVRANVRPLAQRGVQVADDHMFHNYIWMSAGGAALWVLATAGEDAAADRLYEQVARRFNRGLFPAMEYLDGLPSEPMGYWALYDLSPGVLALLGAQSAFEMDLVGRVRTEQNDWLGRHFENLIHSTLPNMRYIPWGDLQSGPNGGVTYEMAGIIDGLTWALDSPHGAHFGHRLAENRGLRRFYGEEAIFYVLYTRHLKTRPALPPLSFLAGNRHSGHFIARSGWEDGDTVVALTATDHFGDHNHYDQGGFTIYRNGLLAVDPPVYRRVRGPQQKTENHNTLLLGGQPQRPVRGQWFKTVEDFRANLDVGRKLETGDVLFHKEAGAWTAAAVEFAQAYAPEAVESCVRQLLFVRPGTVVVVDHLAAPPGKELPEVQWLLQVPGEPAVERRGVWATNGKSWLRCRGVLPGGSTPSLQATDVNTHRVGFTYEGQVTLTLVHVLEVGDGTRPGKPAAVTASQAAKTIDVSINGKKFRFTRENPFEVTGE